MEFNQLTPREVEVLNLLFTGKSDKETAEQLNITVKAVSWHCQQIYKRLGATNRANAFYLALGLDILKPPNRIKQQPIQLPLFG